MNKLIEHHIKYKEIHGVDETKWMTKSEHMKLHNKLRKQGKCNIPVRDLYFIAKNAHYRTAKVQDAYKKRRQSERGKKYQHEYDKKNIMSIDFHEYQGKHTRLHEQIRYNNATGNVSYTVRFNGCNGFKLPVVDI